MRSHTGFCQLGVSMWSLRVAVRIDYTALKDSQVKWKGSMVHAPSIHTSQTNTYTSQSNLPKESSVASDENRESHLTMVIMKLSYRFIYLFLHRLSKENISLMHAYHSLPKVKLLLCQRPCRWVNCLLCKKLFIPCSRCQGETMSPIINVERAHC